MRRIFRGLHNVHVKFTPSCMLEYRDNRQLRPDLRDAVRALHGGHGGTRFFEGHAAAIPCE